MMRELGVLSTIDKGLGARFLLQKLVLPDHSAIGADVYMAFEFNNCGFA